jgi:hypothetical protein
VASPWIVAQGSVSIAFPIVQLKVPAQAVVPAIETLLDVDDQR